MSQTPATLFSTLRGKARTGILVEGVGLVLTVFVGFMLFSFALDRTLRLETVYRACLLVLLAAGIWHVLRKSVFRPIRFELTDDELALAMERGADLHQSLISAVQFERVIAGSNPGDESVELMSHVVRDVHGRVAGLRREAALDVGRVRRFGATLFGCLVLVGAWGVLDHGSLVLWAKRNLLLMADDWPRANQIAFAMDTEDGVVRLPEGNDLTVEVVATKAIPDQVFIDYEFADGTTGRQAMVLSGEAEAGGQRFTLLLESVISNVVLTAVGGDAKEQELAVEIVKRPILQDLVITRTYPEYMDREPDRVNASEGDLRLPAGTTLSIQGKSTKRLEEAYLSFGQDEKQLLDVDKASSTFRGTFAPAKSGVLTLDVTDRDGLGVHNPPKLFLRVVQDQAPVIDYKTSGIGSMILYKALIPATLKIHDDFGITKIVAKIRVSPGLTGQPRGPDAPEIPWEVVADKEFDGLRQPSKTENEVEYEERIVFDLLSRNDEKRGPDDPKNPIRPGMLLALQFDAEDNFGPGARHLGQSEVLTLRIVDEDKLMRDLHRRQLERRRELTQILAKEKSYKDEIDEIVSPTSPDSRAKLAGLRLRAIARDQLALQKQVIAVAERYRQILDEYFNNRLLKPAQILKQRQGIEFPLDKVGREVFPVAAKQVEDFARGGLEDQRTVAKATYGEIIKVLEQVISNMRHLESVAGILEDVRRIRDLERRVENGSKKALDKEVKGAKEIEKGAGPDKKVPGGSGTGSDGKGGGKEGAAPGGKKR